jgi:16S rRNA processing protein RimM
MDLVVARVGRAHGLGGEVSVELRTDIPERRFVVGAVFQTDPAGAGPLELTATRHDSGRWYLRFAEATDRDAAEGLRGVLLVVAQDESDEDDAWYPHELIGLRAERPTGEVVGTVSGLEHPPAHDLMLIREPGGTTARIPFVAAMVPVVDVAGGRVVVDPPFGLLAGEDVDAQD